MRTWGTIAKALDLGSAWDVARHSMKHGGGLASMAAYFTGRRMGTYGRVTRALSSMAVGESAKTVGVDALRYTARQVSFGRAAARIGLAGAGLGVGAALIGRTDTGRRAMRTGMAVGGGVAMYKGLKYGMSRYPGSWKGGSFFGNPMYRRGIATLGGLGTWYGMR